MGSFARLPCLCLQSSSTRRCNQQHRFYRGLCRKKRWPTATGLSASSERTGAFSLAKLLDICEYEPEWRWTTRRSSSSYSQVCLHRMVHRPRGAWTDDLLFVPSVWSRNRKILDEFVKEARTHYFESSLPPRELYMLPDEVNAHTTYWKQQVLTYFLIWYSPVLSSPPDLARAT